MTRGAALGLYTLALAMAGTAHAQDAPVDPVNWRYDEDWSVLRDRDLETEPRWIRAKYLPLDDDGRSWLSTGVEARARYEGYRGDEWGSAGRPDRATVWLRVMPHADLHAGAARGFVQLIASRATGPGRSKGPADETGIDLLQGFGDLRLPLGKAAFTLRGGREMVALGSERLVGTRYGPNDPRAFDGARAIGDIGRVRIQFLALRPVRVGPRDFDDAPSSMQRLSGIYAGMPVGPTGLDLYLLDYRNTQALYEQGAGHEHRRTWGARLYGHSGRWSWNWEAMLQRGRFDGAPIRAWSLATETNVRLAPLTLRLRANLAGGDHDRADPVLQTFNPMFPKGKYFGELSPLGPYNIINLHPAIEMELGHGVNLGLVGIAYWRESRGDGIYSVSGSLIRAGSGGDPAHVGNQGELVLEWRAGSFVSLTASYSIFVPGAFVRATGPSRTIHMVGLEAMFRL